MEIDLGVIVVAALATILGATIQGAIGFGMNLVTVPVLALTLPEALPVTVIVLGLPIAISVFLHEHHAVDRAGVGWIMAGRVPGTVCGALVVATVSTVALQTIVSVVVLALVAASLLVPPITVSAGTQLTAGIVSGATGTAAGIGGPPLALLYQHHPGPTMRSTLAAAFFFGTCLSLATLAIAGEVGADQLLLGAGLAPLVVVGGVAGRRFHDWLDRGWLRPSVLVFVSITAGVALIDAWT